MGFWRNFLTGQPLEEKKESEACDISKKPVEDKPKSVWEKGNLSKKDLAKYVGHEDFSGCSFTSGEYSSHKEELRKMYKEVTAYKKNDWETFSKQDIKDIIEKLKHTEPKNVSELLIKAFEEISNQ